MFDHVSVGVRDLDRAVTFYDATLAPLGLVRLFRSTRAAGYGPEGFEGEAPFAVIAFGDEARPMLGLHLAFVAKDRAAVDAFFAAAVAHGGVDDGPPGIRASYDPGYYAAFVHDPDGNRLEAVLHEG
ncbi:MAG: VOC family protein [Sandaracinus sp.]|nr:VOC family protein [Sandaracinus sp.]